MVTKEDVLARFKQFYIPMLPFLCFDILSTYLGVCVLGGFEMQGWAVNFGVKYGFAAMTLFYFGQYIFGILVLSFFYEMKKDSEMWRVFIIFLWSLLLLDLIRILMLNANSIVYQVTNIKMLPIEQLKAIPVEQIKALAQKFYPVRDLFCRII